MRDTNRPISVSRKSRSRIETGTVSRGLRFSRLRANSRSRLAREAFRICTKSCKPVCLIMPEWVENTRKNSSLTPPTSTIWYLNRAGFIYTRSKLKRMAVAIKKASTTITISIHSTSHLDTKRS
ncbi:hypothetical protein D9M69_651350 [compost metagenome]